MAAPEQAPERSAGAELSVERFRAELEVFSGPLDLLLRITDRYLAAVRTMEFFDINVAAEFLVVAATLMEIKSRTLLPPDPSDEAEEEDDPGVELVRRLIEYKEFREAAEHLEVRAKTQAQKHRRPPLRPADESTEEPEALLEELAVWDLMAAFAEVIEQTRLKPTSARIIHGDVPVSVYMDEVLSVVRRSRGPVDFLDFFRRESERPRIVGIFLALLELFRRRLIMVTETADGSLSISLREPETEAGTEPDAETNTEPDAEAGTPPLPLDSER